jgi:hypothetical protein
MASITYSVTLHHLASGATKAGLAYADEQLSGVNADQLRTLLDALQGVASRLTIYEPSSPEIRIKTDREVFVVRTRYRQLCLVGSESALRGEEHSIAYILAAITGQATPVASPAVNPRLFERPPTSIPLRMPARSGGGGGFPEWLKIALMAVVSLSLLAGGVWMLFRPARTFAPKYTLMPAAEAAVLLTKAAGQYETGTASGDRRIIVGNDGTLRIAKYGADKSIEEEIIRTSRGATQNGKPALVTTDPYVMVIQDADSITLYGLTFKRVLQ